MHSTALYLFPIHAIVFYCYKQNHWPHANHYLNLMCTNQLKNYSEHKIQYGPRHNLVDMCFKRVPDEYPPQY